MKKFPTDAKTKLLMADEIREETGGKLTLFGYLPGNEIRLTIPPDVPAGAQLAMNLCLLWGFADGDGDFDAKITLHNPSNVEIASITQKVSKPAGSEMNVIMKIAPLIISGLGIYKATATLDQTRYERDISIIQS